MFCPKPCTAVAELTQAIPFKMQGKHERRIRGDFSFVVSLNNYLSGNLGEKQNLNEIVCISMCMCLYVCVHVCEREKERETDSHRIQDFSFGYVKLEMSQISLWCINKIVDYTTLS